MSLYAQTIKNLVAGISQQPPILRLPEQLETQINGYSTEVAGLQKRPPSLHIKTLPDFTLNDTAEPLVHCVKRDAHERYMMTFMDNTVKIVDLTGEMQQVTFDAAVNPSYLQTSQPRKDLKILTVADYTFVVNKKITTKMQEAKSPNTFKTQGVLVNVKQGQYGRTYVINIDGKEAARFSTPDGSDKSHTHQIDTSYIVNQLADKAKVSGYTCDIGDSWLRIQGATSVTTQDGFNNQAMIGIKDTVQRFSLLPSTAPEGYTVAVKGDPNGNDAGKYYVVYDATAKVWEECCKPDMLIAFDPKTMPHALVRNADSTFTLKPLEWAERKVGDEDSNPLPSFIGQGVTDVFFFRNRLGFAAGENILLSESGEFFNFWMTTANDLLDTDCIDIPATSTQVNILQYVVPYNEDLYAFSNDAQFVLRVDSVLSPKNVALPEITSFNSSPDCRPVVAGKNLYFPAERAEYTSIKEYYTVQDISDIKNAQDITSHVPSYIPNGVYQIIANTSENLLFVLTQGDPTALYVYKYLFVNEQRVQSSWSKWELGGVIFGGFFVDSMFYFLVKRGSRVTLESINFTFETTDYEEEEYRAYIDRKKIAQTSFYDGIYERTGFNVFTEYESNDLTGIEKIGVVLPRGQYKEIPKEDIGVDGVFYIEGKYTNETVILGTPYMFKATLGAIYIRKQDQSGGVHAVTTGRLQLRNLHIHYNNTGGFTTEVKLIGGKTYTYRMTARTLGTASSKLGILPSSIDTFRFPVQTLNTNCQISILSDMPLPVAIIGLLWEGSYIQRTKGG